MMNMSNKHVSKVCVYTCVCASPAYTSLLSLGIRSYRWLLREGSGPMSQGENIIVALTSVWKCSEWVSCSRDLAGHHQPHQTLRSLHILMKTYEFIMNREAKQKKLESLVKSNFYIKKRAFVFLFSSGQEHEVSIWGDVRAWRVFSKSSNPCGIIFRPRSSAEHPSTNSHQSVSAEGNAQKVYFKTQCDFTLPPSAGGGGGARSALLTVRTNQGWCLIRHYEISQEAGLVTDTQRSDAIWFTEKGEIILTWCKLNGNVTRRVIIREGDTVFNEDKARTGAGKSLFSLSQHSSKRLLIDSPDPDLTRYAQVFWTVIDPRVLSVDTVLCCGTLSAKEHVLQQIVFLIILLCRILLNNWLVIISSL